MLHVILDVMLDVTQDIYFYFFNQTWIFRKNQSPTFTFFRRHDLKFR